MRHARPDYDRIQDPENKIPEDEPVFLLRACDATAAQTLEYWIGLNMQRPDCDMKMIALAKEQLGRIRRWPVKETADCMTPEYSLDHIPMKYCAMLRELLPNYAAGVTTALVFPANRGQPSIVFGTSVKDVRTRAGHRIWPAYLDATHSWWLVDVNTLKVIPRDEAISIVAGVPADA